MKPLTPPAIAPPFAAYSHAIVSHPARMVFTSGQLGVAVDGSTPQGARAQAEICFANIDAILAEADMTRAAIVRLNAYVTGREHMQGYMAARDAWLADIAPLPASTLMIVSGFTRPEFVVEIEAIAVEEV
jgi:enamine deaminase RidA (YjgF/YER057c/UK114 family)